VNPKTNSLNTDIRTKGYCYKLNNMKKTYSLLFVVTLLIAACSKKNAPVPVTLPGIPTITATVSAFAGGGNPGAPVNGFGNTASFNVPLAIAADAAGNVYVSDLGNNLIRKINSNGLVTTLAGSGATGNANGTGTHASFSVPNGIAVDAAGNVYVADYGNNLIRKITPDGLVTTLAGSGAPGAKDGTGTDASFNSPAGVAADAAGNVYVADYGNNLIRKITPERVVTTFAGATEGAGYFNGPTSVTADAAGNVYVADYDNNRVEQINVNGQIITLSYLYHPSGITLGPGGNIYASLPLYNQVWQIHANGQAAAVAGSGFQGSDNGIGAAASFYSPSGITSDAAGNIYVADSGNNLIRKIVIK
jgi:sugar lactone lactonase YvrE